MKPAHPYPMALGPDWTRVSRIEDGMTAQHFTHPAGYVLRHVGHPAQRRWALTSGKSRRLFESLEEAREFVEHELAGAGGQ